MKISKVDNNRTGVKKSAQGVTATTGYMYKSPKSYAKADINVDAIVDKRIDASKKVPYNIFDLNKVKKVKADYNIATAINEHFWYDIIKPNKNTIKIVDLRKRINANHLTDDRVDELIEKALRNSLSKPKTIDALKKYISYACQANCTINNRQKSELINSLLSVIWADYNREKVRKHASKGIQNQDMKFQPTKLSGKDILMPPSKKTGEAKGKGRKEAFAVFLTEFADLDKEKRDDLLRRLRRLVTLYFYGEGEVNKEPGYDFWKEHNERKSNDDKLIYVQEDSGKITPVAIEADALKGFRDEYFEYKNNNVRIKDYVLKEIIRKINRIWYSNCRDVIEKVCGDESGENIYFQSKDLNRFWMDRISKSVESIYSHRPGMTHKLRMGYLSEKVWKELVGYISAKYIELGKAVFNTAVEDLNISNGSEKEQVIIEPGTIKTQYISNGITSFDYEKIKAEEQLQRELQVMVAFAANNLASAAADAVGEGMDFLADRVKIKNNSEKQVLQFFGGESSWNGFVFLKKDELVHSMRKILYALRNENFHFKTLNINNGNWDEALISKMFDKEADKCTIIIKDKFFSNNLPSYYRDSDLKDALDKLYKDNTVITSQIPSFKKLFPWNAFPNYINDIIPNKGNSWTDEEESKWHGAVYYLLKEIYYNDFIKADIIDDFVEKVRLNLDNEKDKKKKRANDDFYQRILSIKESINNITLSEMCQIIMTEQNQQNQGKRKKLTKEKEQEKKYKHFRDLLYKNLKETFTDYWKGMYCFILIPSKWNKGNERDFLNDYSNVIYDGLKSEMGKKRELQKWYILGRLLNGKQINELIGDVRSYLSYKADIERRARDNGIIKSYILKDEKEKLEKALEILDICRQLFGRTSNDYKDYFEDEDEYADFVGKFLDYERIDGISSSKCLRDFCNGTTGNPPIGIFYDGANPIVNKNIVLARLYGNYRLLESVMKDQKVTIKDIMDLRASEKKILQYKSKGLCSNESEQKELKKYQELKNHAEFRDIMEYKDIIDELYGKLLISMYLKERDLLYFQLGFHYYCLNNNSKKPDDYKVIEITDNGKTVVKIKNAILYQIMAVYINGLSVYKREDNDKKKEFNGKKEATIGTRKKRFDGYATPMVDSEGPIRERKDLYNAGLEVFENINEHEELFGYRNYIEHFKYYSTLKYSMLDLYSDLFDRGFSYDKKLRKNVVNLIYNVLLGHFIKTSFTFSTVKSGYNTNRDHAQIELSAYKSMESEVFTYKLSNDGKIDIPAKSKRFMETVATLLYYPGDVPAYLDIKVINNNNDDGDEESNTDRRRTDQGKQEHRNKTVKENVKWSEIGDGETAIAKALRKAQEKKSKKQ